jgi:hypothetical protein
MMHVFWQMIFVFLFCNTFGQMALDCSKERKGWPG